MALHYAATAEGLIERFRNNDVRNDKWRINDTGWTSLLGWTARQGRDVLDAVEHNTSIRFVDIRVVDEMTGEAIDVLSLIIGRLHGVLQFEIWKDFYTAPTPMEKLNRLIAAVARCPSNVKHLDCSGMCLSPRGLLSLASSFPNIETLDVGGPRHPPNHCEVCATAEDFALTFAVSVGMLPSLRRVQVGLTLPHPALPTLLSGLYKSVSVREIEVTVPRGADDLVRAAKCLCACTESVETFSVRGEDGAPTDMTAFFDIGPIRSFSPTVTHVELFNCDFSTDFPDKLVKGATRALQNVTFLRFGRCRFPSAMKVVEGLPNLTSLSIVGRTFVDEKYESIVNGDYDATPYMLITNQDVEDLCFAVERQGTLLNDIELDLVSDNGESFPAISRLMMACKGRLVLNFGENSWRLGTHLVEGAGRLRDDLKDLRLRFVDCDLEDHNYASLFRTLASNKTLTHLEIGFDEYEGLESPELSSVAIRELIESNDTLQALAIRNLPTNAAATVLERIVPALATTNRSLRDLEVGGAAGVTESLPMALDVLKENDVLSTLDGFNVPEGGPVEFLLLQNRYGRIFLRANDPNPIGIWATVLARVSRDQQIGIMYKFLRAKPGLVRRRRTPAAPTASSSFGDDGVVVIVGQKRRRSATE